VPPYKGVENALDMAKPKRGKKGKKQMSASEALLDKVLHDPTWSLRPPDDVREDIAALLKDEPITKLAPLIWDIIRDELPGRLKARLAEQRVRRKLDRGGEPTN
jgi:hypothetical protein